MKSIKLKYRNLFFLFSSLVLGFLISLAITFLLSYFTAPRIPLLGFHGIIDSEKPAPISVQRKVPPEMDYDKRDLEIFLEYLIHNKYWFITPQNLYEYFLIHSQEIPPEHLGERPIMLSFDDGYKTIHTNLLPLLEKLEKKYAQKVKVVLFVNSGTLAKSKSPYETHMRCQELREGYKKGFYDVQSHGWNHKNLTKLNNQELTDELSKAQTELRACLKDLDPMQQVASHIAYPYGDSNQKVESYASRYYLSSYLYNSRILRSCWLRDYYQIPRLTVNRRKSPNQLIQMAERSHQLMVNEKCDYITSHSKPFTLDKDGIFKKFSRLFGFSKSPLTIASTLSLGYSRQNG